MAFMARVVKQAKADSRVNWYWHQFGSRKHCTALQRQSGFARRSNWIKSKMIFSPLSSFESSLGGLWRFLCDDKLDECELLLVLLLIFNRLCCGGPPKCGRVKNGANIGNWPNCRNGAHGRDRGAKCAATAASCSAGCNPGGLPDIFDSKLWCPSTISTDSNRLHFFLKTVSHANSFGRNGIKFLSLLATARHNSGIVFN